ncbi:MAG: ABC transporter permease subunit [Spirochaetaceae bacterium]|jgi:osmoprotectant transport system permease protein|nr:ABC transporter permease subunit [Spirochaetaceae bacterium]
MFHEIGEMLVSRSDFFLQLTMEHLEISVISILIAGILGLGIGIFISEYQKSSGIILTLVNIIYTIPSISLLGFLIPFSGIGDKTAIIALSIYALLPMVRGTHTGMTNINPAVIEAAQGMGSTNFQILYKIRLPLAVPVIISGLRNMVVMTIALTGIASFIGAGGLGVAIYRGITTNNTGMTVTGSLLIALIAFVTDFLIGMIEKLVKRERGTPARRFSRSAVWITVAAVVFVAAGVLAAAVVVSSRADRKNIHIATKPMTEQYILGEMLTLLLEEDEGFRVQLTQGVGGGTSNIQPGMENGAFDLYPEYTGTGWNAVLKNESIYEESMFDTLSAEYRDRFGFEWVGMYGFNNTYGLAVRREIADRYNLVTYSDLAAVSGNLVFGAEYDFYEREDGFDALCAAYGYSFRKTMDMDIGLKYQAINQKQIDVMNIFTTDGQLSVSDITVLLDDKKIYPSYLCGNVVRIDVLERYPGLRGALEKVNGIISDADMAYLNYLVESRGAEPTQVARGFLEDKGLLKKEGAK